MGDVGLSNWNNHHSELTDTDLIDDDQIDDSMDEESFPSFIQNADDPKSHLTNLTGRLYLLTLAEEEEERQCRRIHT